jgi:molybdopterin/thiamine biosynthesis adenylyltransferase
MSFSDDEVERYARQLVLAELGGQGQQKLKAAKVLIVGCGGVGGPAALYLAAAGVGQITLIDPDRVALSNLHRQIQFATEEIGDEKTEATAGALKAINPNVRVFQIFAALDADNAPAWIADHDLVIDGTDDFATRLLVSDTCTMLEKPLVSGALGRWAGQIGVFTGRPCYRCLVPEVPPEAETCQRVGVVGALAGVVGSMAALEAVKLIIGAGQALDGRLLIYDGLKAEARTVEVAADPACRACGARGDRH